MDKFLSKFNWLEQPIWIRQVLDDAVYLGGGHSSKVWSLNNGYVLKMTNDPVVISFVNNLVYLHSEVENYIKPLHKV